MQYRHARQGFWNTDTTYVVGIFTILLHYFQKTQALSNLAEPHWDIPSPPTSLLAGQRANRWPIALYPDVSHSQHCFDISQFPVSAA